MKRIFVLLNISSMVLGVFILFFCSSCAFIELQKDLDRLEGNARLHGAIAFEEKRENPNVVVVFDLNKKLVAYKRMHYKDLSYLFMLPANKRYSVFGFSDLNNNKLYDDNEPAFAWLNSKGVELKAGGRYPVPLMVFKKDNSIPLEYVKRINKASLMPSNQMIIRAGVVADINNPIFDAEHGTKGLWTPLKAFGEVGGGVYFLEKYDKKKVPILFIHGIGGCPQTWKSFFKSVDHDKFQIWFFHYPSGYRIHKVSRALINIMSELRNRYEFKRLFIVTHSMGGLVASSFIIETSIKGNADYVKLLITLSSPWNGSASAAFGVKYSPSVVPSWKDLRKGSEYIAYIHRYNVGKIVPFYNLFSYKGSSIPYNDGAVELNSQLYLEIQEEARKCIGFNCDHKEILHDKNVLEYCNQVFNEYYDTR